MTASEQMRSTWESGGTALGAWVSLRDPLIAETAASVGYDYVCLDMQHGMQDYRDIVAMLSAMARTPVTPIVRVPWNEPGIIGRVLDAGAYGVIIPMVNSAEQAMAAVASAVTRQSAAAVWVRPGFRRAPAGSATSIRPTRRSYASR